jgi:hypothetical protein
MLKVIRLESLDQELGGVVELREPTMDQFLAIQKETAGVEDEGGTSQSMLYLGRMIHVNGEPLGRERLGSLGMSVVLPLLPLINEMFPQGGDEGNA